jgi:hypothetical protein
MYVRLSFLNVKATISRERIVKVRLRLDPIVVLVPARNRVRSGVICEKGPVVPPCFLPKALREASFFTELTGLQERTRFPAGGIWAFGVV